MEHLRVVQTVYQEHLARMVSLVLAVCQEHQDLKETLEHLEKTENLEPMELPEKMA